MAKTLSQDLHSRVIAAVQGGMSRRAAAESGMRLGEATAIRWLRKFIHSGGTAAEPKGGDCRSHRIEAYGA
jgi:transposase